MPSHPANLPAAIRSRSELRTKKPRTVQTSSSAGNSALLGPTSGSNSNTNANRENGGPGESRTPDKRFRKPLLYPSELQARRGSLKLFQILADWGRQERPDSRKTLFPQRNLRLLFPTVGYGLKGFLT